ncbi:Hypothetical protein KLENKIAIHU_3252 [Klenkia terrae]|nr:Hypothetical protein KLENKIAIHU_3252 [Klenkia terrae]
MPTIAPTPPPAATTSGVYGVSTTGPIPTSVPGDVATDRPVDVGSGSRVVVTYAAWSSDTGKIDASAYVAGVVEDGGTCTVTATSAAATRSASSAASADATTTVCADLVVPWSAADGSPSVVVGYQSATTSAQSDLTTVEVDR